ncbi:hypothetical protein HMPREF1039_1039, partial [Megasphaera lornae]
MRDFSVTSYAAFIFRKRRHGGKINSVLTGNKI